VVVRVLAVLTAVVAMAFNSPVLGEGPVAVDVCRDVSSSGWTAQASRSSSRPVEPVGCGTIAQGDPWVVVAVRHVPVSRVWIRVLRADGTSLYACDGVFPVQNPDLVTVTCYIGSIASLDIPPGGYVALAVDPASGRELGRRQVSVAAQSPDEAAREYCGRADLRAMMGCALALGRRGDVSGAVQVAHQAWQRFAGSPDSGMALRVPVWVAGASGDWKAAESEAVWAMGEERRVLRREPGWGEYVTLARVAAMACDAAAAEQAAATAVRLHPHPADLDGFLRWLKDREGSCPSSGHSAPGTSLHGEEKSRG
jgi:hypothetical protein